MLLFFWSHKISRAIRGFPIEPKAVFFHQIESNSSRFIKKSRFESIRFKIRSSLIRARLKNKMVRARLTNKIVRASLKNKIVRARLTKKIVRARLKNKIVGARLENKIVRARLEIKIVRALTTHHDEFFFGFLQPQPHQKSDCWRKRSIENKNKNRC